MAESKGILVRRDQRELAVAPSSFPDGLPDGASAILKRTRIPRETQE
jgi:hypothetical protein